MSRCISGHSQLLSYSHVINEGYGVRGQGSGSGSFSGVADDPSANILSVRNAFCIIYICGDKPDHSVL